MLTDSTGRPNGPTAWQLVILSHIAEEGPTSTRELRLITGQRPSSVATTVTRMVDRGLLTVVEQTCPGGRLVALTPLGLEHAP